MKMPTTTQLVEDQLDTVREGYTVSVLVELTGKSETSVRKALKDLVHDGEAVKDESGNYRRPSYRTDNDESDVVADAMDATMREQMATSVPEDEVRPEHADEQSPEQADLEAALRASLEAQNASGSEAGSTDQPTGQEASEDAQPGKKKYRPRRAHPDRPVRTNQKTKSQLQVLPRDEFEEWLKKTEAYSVNSGEDAVKFTWYTVCHTHSTFTGTNKIMSAWNCSTNPESFCPGCSAVVKA